MNNVLMEHNAAEHEAEEMWHSTDPVWRCKQEISQVKRMFSHLMNSLLEMQSKIESAEEQLGELQRQQDIATDEALNELSSSAAAHEDKLSEVALRFIETLGSDAGIIFKKFLFDATYGKPKPSVLPIVRRWYRDVDETKNLLMTLKVKIDEHHQQYMKERNANINLKRRIERLLTNIDKELEKEVNERLTQTTMDQFL